MRMEQKCEPVSGDAALDPTRRTLIERLKNWNDEKSWKLFFDTYWKLIYNSARRAGLNDAESQDVVQETIVKVCASMPEFDYGAEGSSFKGWLLKLTSWRIADELRRRSPAPIPFQPAPGDPDTGVNVIDKLPNPIDILQEHWDSEYDSNLLEAAFERVKLKVDAKRFQIFDLQVRKGWPVARVARVMKINPARVYLCKHRVGLLLRKELAYLRTKPI